MTDIEMAAALGARLEQLRLQANIPQQALAQELGISEGTYRSAIKGKVKLEVFVGLLRLLGASDGLDSLLPQQPFSPMALLNNAGKQRRRAHGTLAQGLYLGDSNTEGFAR